MKFFRLYISVALFILLATGCIAVGPSYNRPSVKLAKIWLDAENIALGGVKPKSLLDSTFGIEIVKDELTRIEHGILA